MDRKRLRLAAFLMAMALVSTACGARVSEQELTAAGFGAGGDGELGGDFAGDAGQLDGSGVVGGEGGSGGTSEGSVTGGSAGQAGTAGRAGTAGQAGGPTGGGSPAPSGGNGGATDIGVTETQILLGNISTVTGPVPGLFAGAQAGAKAFAAYQNSVGGVYGRQLAIEAVDDRLDGGTNRAQVIALQKRVFAFLGSFSVVDDGGSEELKKSGVPDVGYSLSQARQTLPNNFSPQPLPPGWREGPLNLYKEMFGDEVIKKVAGFYTDVPSAKEAYLGQKAAAEALGYEYVYERALSTSEANYTSDVLQMRNRGAEAIFMTTDATNMARMAKAMEDQGFSVTLPNYGANAYDPKFLSIAGSAAEGAIIDMQLPMYIGEDRGHNAEIDLFLTWMERVAPDVPPDIFAAFSWASGRLLVQALEAAGPQLTRAGLLGALGQIDQFDSNGLVAPAGPASKRPQVCFMVIKVEGGKFVRMEPEGQGLACDRGGYFRKQ